MIVDDRVLAARQQVFRAPPQPLDTPVLNQYRSILEINTRGRPGRLKRIVRKGEDAAADDACVDRSSQNVLEPQRRDTVDLCKRHPGFGLGIVV